MPKFTDPFNSPSPSRKDPSRENRRSSSTGYVVEPGKVLNKVERCRRKTETKRVDSVVGSLDGDAVEYEYSWTALGEKLTLFTTFDQHFAPGTCIGTAQDIQTGQHSHNFRSLIVTVITLVIVFGTFYTLLEYLLYATRASATCTPSTVFIPITYTVTTCMSSSPTCALSSGVAKSSRITTVTLTSTSTETYTSYVTLGSSTASAATAPSSSDPSYFYTVNSAGVTEWANGHSPSPGASLVTLTTSITVQPVASVASKAAESAAEKQSTTAMVGTMTPPQYTSTIFSFVTPDLTSTSTSTHYVTYTVSQLSSSAEIAATRTLFSSMMSGGWNASTSADPDTSAQTVNSAEPTETTLTSVYYIGTGDKTTSTSTTFITTTVAIKSTVTVTPSSTSLVNSGYVTTITALPLTITPTYDQSTYMTSLPISRVSSSSATSNGSLAGGQTATSSSSSLVVISNSSASVAFTASSSALSLSIASVGHSGIFGPSTSTMASVHSASTITALGSYSYGVNQSSSLTSPSARTSNVTTSRTVRLSTSHSHSNFSTTTNSSATLPAPHKSTLSATSPAKSSHSISSSSSTCTLANSTLCVTKSKNYTSLSTSSTASSGAISAASVLTTANSSTTSESHRTGHSQGYSTTGSTTLYSRSHVTSLLSTGSSAIGTQTNSSKVASHPSTESTISTSNSKQSASSSSSASTLITTSSAVTSNMTSQSTSTLTSSNPFPPSSATATPTAGCGEHGDFLLTFDDLPNFTPSNQNGTDITQAPPIFSPYHHLTFSDGYVYAPQPSEPYQPVSPPHVAVFLANARGMTANSFSNPVVNPGEIGDGQYDPMSAFWFDAYSAFFGCDDAGPTPCTLVFKGYTWSQFANTEIMTYAQNATVPACPRLKDCQLNKVEFPTSFRGLTGLQIQAFVGKEQKMFFMDNLALHWSNNTCAAGLIRQSSQ